MKYVVFDETTGSALGMYEADAVNMTAMVSEGRVLIHARLPEGVDARSSKPVQINGEWVAQ